MSTTVMTKGNPTESNTATQAENETDASTSTTPKTTVNTPIGVRRPSKAHRDAASRLKTSSRTVYDDLFHWYHRLSPSLILENKGSVARDHLANERTFLAWLRTSLSITTVGVAITQLFRLDTSENNLILNKAGRPLGGSFIILGIMFLFFALARYFHAQTLMAENKFPASRGTVLFGTVLILAILIAMFVIIIVMA